MKEFQKKRRMKKFIYSKAMVVFLLFILFFLARGTYRIYQRSSESRSREQSAAINLARLQERQERLEADVAFLETRVGIEDQLRHHYSFAREGEKVVIIIDETVDDFIIEDEPEGFMEKTRSWFRRRNLLR